MRSLWTHSASSMFNVSQTRLDIHLVASCRERLTEKEDERANKCVSIRGDGRAYHLAG